MPLFLTLDNVYKLYNIDPSKKAEGMFIIDQNDQPQKEFTDYRHQFDGLLLGFMLKGSMRTQIHFLEYEVHADDTLVVLPQLMIETKTASEDAEFVTIGLSLDFITAFPILREFIMNDQIRWNPIVKLLPESIGRQKELLALLQDFYHSKQSSKKTEILQHLIIALICMISEVYSSLANNNSLVKNRVHEIIDGFYILISKHANQERSVKFYAEKLHLTPQYLSTLLKQKTGKSVIQWVDHVMILHAKTLLKSSNLSIKQISSELNFADTSLFCRYFKRLTGSSPRNFRNKT
ncbi:transcriptional regulator [Chryseobacterium sp. StRB126]|uniref:helix-turn-helix domain-containing protein n=1 Tax=Chryseobacterium sp. StRB126 TaxID=878220 RepID=UPI0004E98D16|nr:AraC family transcriptional regulator [Chryseobacterium sp. StRB126]BAP32367.1 transcriptional regulator [Chryseobacterium sp. StRB126]